MSVFASTFIAGFNHLLGQAPWARERLTGHAGRRARIESPILGLQFEITADGFVADASRSDVSPDVVLTLPADVLPRLMQGMAELMSQVHISGNAEFADALGFVLRNLSWNSEEDLSRVVGDLAAPRLDRSLRALLAFPPKLAGAMARTARDYLVDEKPTVTDQTTARQFTKDIHTLRDDLARLEKRLEKLERR